MPTKKKVTRKLRPKAALVEIFLENGYMRVPNLDRREEEPRDYKKGYEIRLVTNTKREIADIRRLLRQVGLKGGKPFKKHYQWIQPIYGRETMERFEEWVKQFG